MFCVMRVTENGVNSNRIRAFMSRMPYVLRGVTGYYFITEKGLRR